MQGTKQPQIRISSGIYRGRKYSVSSGLRPTKSILREALFSMLEGKFEGGTFVDICSGTGCVAFEALSRGAEKAVLIEKDPRIFAASVSAAEKIGIEGAVFLNRECLSVLQDSELFDDKVRVFYFDPPYDSKPEIHPGMEAFKRCKGALFIEEHRKGCAAVFKGEPFRTRTYGNSAITVFII
ncbi:MAG: RsmD family RNA methyltransferase [Fibrobacterota bacterium]